MIITTQKGEIAYDEVYHKGINIIRGKNSSGKSTITHFIFYVLGGAFNDWVKEAKLCSLVTAEIEINGATITLKREIKFNADGKSNAFEALYFYWGDLEKSKTDSDGWQKFNFSTLGSSKSFSNVLFESLDLPIVKGDNNITFHQILRLLYIDQDSPTSSLFLYELFDSSLTRETVSDLLLGVYSQELYDKKQRQVNALKENDEVKKEIKVIKKFVANPQDLIPATLNTKIQIKEAEISEKEIEILAIKENARSVRYTSKTKLEFEELNSTAILQREKVALLDRNIKAIKFEIADTEYFIEALNGKLQAIGKSILTRKLLGDFPLESCPECLTEIHVIEEAGVCKLCKQKIDDSFGITQAKKIEQELSFQIKESNNIILIRQRNLIDLEAHFESEKIKLHQIQQQVNFALNDIKSIREEKYDKLFVDKGFLEGEILQLRTLIENAEIYQSLIKKQSSLEQELDVLDYEIKKLKSVQEKLKKETTKAIETKGVYLLNNDLKRQRDFFEAKEFHVDFRNNLAFIADKDARYSASSSFYLKTSARFSIFLASLDIDRMRYPRFVFCDNMEDKGIEEIRAQNFQKILIEETEKYDSNDYQMIYTTSFIPEEFNNDTYCVGDYYTEESPSLKNVN